MESPLPIDPTAGRTAAPAQELRAVLARIDGWGRQAWKDITGVWRSGPAVVVIEGARDADDVVLTVVLPAGGLGLRRSDRTTADATGDWLLRRVWTRLIPSSRIRIWTHRPGVELIANTACTVVGDTGSPRIMLRLVVRLPMAGLCCDGPLFGRFWRHLGRFITGLGTTTCRRELGRWIRALQVQRALRAALPLHGLAAFIPDGARLARTADGAPDPASRPLAVPRTLRTTIDLGAWGRFSGLGIGDGVTGLTGGPYQGKSTFLAALAAGRHDRIREDGGVDVVCREDAVLIQSDEGRLIKATHLTGFFPRLPGCDPDAFSTARASGATSMAASLVQAIAAGSRLILIDEDQAAGNFLCIDQGLRRLLGRAHGTTTLVEVLADLASQGVASVLVAGCHGEALAACDRAVLMDHFQPRDVTSRLRMLHPPQRRRLTIHPRHMADDPECLLGHRHFVEVAVDDPERPILTLGERTIVLDLRRCGWSLSPALTRGAISAAAWCCRLAAGSAIGLMDLADRYHAFIGERGVRGLDPFDGPVLALPPWQLVVAVLERLPMPAMAGTYQGEPLPGLISTASARRSASKAQRSPRKAAAPGSNQRS